MLVYVSLAVGLVVGKCVVTGFGVADPSLVLYSLCGAAITMLVATVLTPFREQESFETQIARMTSESAESGDAATGGAAGSEAGGRGCPGLRRARARRLQEGRSRIGARRPWRPPAR